MPHRPLQKQRLGVDAYGRTPQWNLAAQGNLVGVEVELCAGSDPTAADKDSYTALYVASQNGHDAVVAALIQAGANTNAAEQVRKWPPLDSVPSCEPDARD